MELAHIVEVTIGKDLIVLYGVIRERKEVFPSLDLTRGNNQCSRIQHHMPM